MSTESKALSKEDIIHAIIDKKWPIDKNKHTATRNRLAKISTWGIEYDAMSEYAKQECMEFGNWIYEEDWVRSFKGDDKYYQKPASDVIEYKNMEQLYNLYLQSKQQP